MTLLTNRLAGEIAPGMSAETTRLCVADDLYVFANASGNLNPLHLPLEDGDGDGEPEAIAPSMWLAALISAVLGNQLPGPGTLYEAQALTFHERARAGDEVTARAEVLEVEPEGRARLAVSVRRGDGALLVEGEASVRLPRRRVSFEAHIPGVTVRRHRHFEAILARAEPLPAIPTAVVAPEEPAALGGALLAMRRTIIDPILVGDPGRIREAARAEGASLDGLEIVEAPTPIEAARRAVALVHEGRARAVMKGHLHTDELLGAVVARGTGLRTGRRLSHVFVMDVPGLDHLLMVTDAAVNIAPDLAAKVDIVQNAIDLARSLGVSEPKAGILSAVETVTPKIPSTLDAAALSKMAERGQITGGLVDGPLAMDNAVDAEAARGKGLRSLVAGRADILVAPNLEAGNMLAKQLTFIAHAEAAGVVLGARCPIVLTSRADSEMARLASCAVAAIHALAGPA